MNHGSFTFAERLRGALGLGAAENPPSGAVRRARPQGTPRERGQVFADRLRRALDRA